MFVSLWIGIMLAGGQTGCTTPKKTSGPDVVETRRALAPGADGIVRGIRNGDYYQIPKVPPPGVKTTYNSVPVSQPYIAMTFDDGPTSPIQSSGNFSRAFATAGTYTYHCKVHGAAMAGTVIVK